VPRPGALEIESVNRRAWPALEEIADGSWIARFSRGFTNRSNSIQSFDPDDVADIPARLSRFAAAYREHDIRPVFRVTPLTGAAIVAELDRLGWTTYDESIVMLRALDRSSFDIDAPFRIFAATDPEWIAAYESCRGLDAASLATLPLIHARIAEPAGAVLVFDAAGEPAAATLSVVDSGLCMIFNVATRPSRRRLGLGRAAVAAGLAFGARSGAQWASLAVAADNTAALPLYSGLGFTETYRYRYRTPSQA
jgi:ribosomal protein S18 acetylase RimI-like enzyme